MINTSIIQGPLDFNFYIFQMVDFRYGGNYTTVILSPLAAVTFIKTSGSKIRCKPIYSEANQPTKSPNNPQTL